MHEPRYRDIEIGAVSEVPKDDGVQHFLHDEHAYIDFVLTEKRNEEARQMP